MANVYSFSIKTKDHISYSLIEKIKMESDIEGISFSEKLIQIIKNHYGINRQKRTCSTTVEPR